jgi:hypothetical protein
MLARGLIISRRFVKVRTAPKHRSTHILKYQSSEHKSNQHDESDMVKFPCSLKNALLIIRDYFGLPFATKGLGYLAALYLPLPLIVRYKLSCYQTTCYLLFQCLQKIPCWKPLVISFCSSLGSTLLLIERTTIDPLYLWVITLLPWITMSSQCSNFRGALHFCFAVSERASEIPSCHIISWLFWKKVLSF